MINVSNETKVGIFTVATFIVLILGYNYLKGKDLFSSTDTYFAKYQNISGITESTPVLLNGYRIGKVTQITLSQQKDNSTSILVEFTLKSGYKIPLNSIAKIVSTDLVGSKAIQLNFSDETVYHMEFDTLTGQTEISISEAVDKIVSPIDKKLNSLMTKLQNILDEEGSNNLKNTFKNLRELTEKFKITMGRINTGLEGNKMGLILEDLENLTSSLDENKEQIGIILENFGDISDSLKAANVAQTIQNINNLANDLDMVIDKINEGKGTMGLLVNNDTLYHKLTTTVNDVDKLIIDLKENPHRYVQISLIERKNKEKKKK